METTATLDRRLPKAAPVNPHIPRPATTEERLEARFLQLTNSAIRGTITAEQAAGYMICWVKVLDITHTFKEV